MIASPLKVAHRAIAFLQLLVGTILLAITLPFLFIGGMLIHVVLPMTNNLTVWPATKSIASATVQSFAYVVMGLGAIFRA